MKMNGTIEEEIVRLIREISEDEKQIVKIETEAKNMNRMEYFKNGHAARLKSCKDSLERKMQLLRSLRNK
jgi:hypothetical protein